MATDLEICNRALDALGTAPIAALTDTNRAATLCSRYYPQVRDDVLRGHPWNCAVTRVTINADVDPPAFGFAHRYALPADCLRVLKIMGDEDPDVVWQVESGFIVTDEPTPIYALYIRRLTTSIPDPMLVSVIAARLAMEIALPLTGSQPTRQQMEREFLQRLRAARSADGQEGTPLRVGADDFGLSRL